MEVLSNALERTLGPLAGKIAQNKYLQVLSQTFISLLPVIVIGAFALILSKSPVSATGFEEGSTWFVFFTAWNDWATTNLGALKFINAATLGSLSLWVSVGIGYRWARKYDLDVLPTITVAVVNFLLLNSQSIESGWLTSFFGGTGLFSAIIGSFLTVQLYRFLVKRGVGAIKFPPSVPASLSNAVGSMLPMALTMLAGAVVAALAYAFAGGATIAALVMELGKPLNIAIDNPLGISAVSSLGQLAFWFGIHNSAILSIFQPILYSNLAANASAYAAGADPTALPYIVNQAFFYNFVTPGGAGATLALVILLLRSRSESMKAVGKLSLVPALFGINEPVIFGLPIMLNIKLLIPWIFVPIVNIVVAYSAMAVGLLNKPIFYMGGTAPEVIKSVLSNMDLRSVVLWVVLLLVDLVLWYPFFKSAEADALKEEGGTKSEEKPAQQALQAVAA